MRVSFSTGDERQRAASALTPFTRTTFPSFCAYAACFFLSRLPAHFNNSARMQSSCGINDFAARSALSNWALLGTQFHGNREPSQKSTPVSKNAAQSFFKCSVNSARRARRNSAFSLKSMRCFCRAFPRFSMLSPTHKMLKNTIYFVFISSPLSAMPAW